MHVSVISLISTGVANYIFFSFSVKFFFHCVLSNTIVSGMLCIVLISPVALIIIIMLLAVLCLGFLLVVGIAFVLPISVVGLSLVMLCSFPPRIESSGMQGLLC